MHQEPLTSERREAEAAFRVNMRLLKSAAVLNLTEEDLFSNAVRHVAFTFRPDEDRLPRELERFVRGYVHGMVHRASIGKLESPEAEFSRVITAVGGKSRTIR